MKALKELRELKLKLSSTDLYFGRIKSLQDRKLDFNVWLPTRHTNLQRGKVWTLQQKRELIMSVFIERYIPSICAMSLIDGDGVTEKDVLQIIDGKQRLTTFIDFYNNEFTVEIEGVEYYFKDLPQDYQNSFANYEVKGQLAYEDYDHRFTDEDKINWFKRINFFGTPQDIEHLKKLA